MDAAAAAAGGGVDTLAHLLATLAAVVGLGWILARLCARLGQPPVIGEVLAGILLGPSLLGQANAARLLPPQVAPQLGAVAQLGVILYLFTIGLGMHGDAVRRRAGATIAIAQAGIVAPFLLGAALAVPLFPRLAPAGVAIVPFALFLGTAMAITAFPVLARILADTGLTRTPLGGLALAAAAIADVSAWCLLAVVTGIAKAEVGAGVLVVVGAAVYLGVLLGAVRPLLARALAGDEGDTPARGVMALVFMGLLLSALATQAIGIHALFGAFLFGAVIPHDSGVARALGRALEAPVGILLLPAFFAFTGMRTRIDLISGAEEWMLCAAIVVVATAGKFGGTFLAARLSGMAPRDAAGLGALMNTRGLMELIVLNVGLDLGVISPTLFSMLVLMALVTTFATAPLLKAIRPSPTLGADAA
ncbi:MAG TPA: cation:proton antiporter [Dongiaceae bacterium]|nr:cation:proton antiporter [Dongiaceae bacterium]